jgi:UDP-glucose 4-epimerase
LTIVNKFKEVNGVDFQIKFVDRRAGDIEGIGYYVRTMLPYNEIEEILLNSDEYKESIKYKNLITLHE